MSRRPVRGQGRSRSGGAVAGARATVFPGRLTRSPTRVLTVQMDVQRGSGRVERSREAAPYLASPRGRRETAGGGGECDASGHVQDARPMTVSRRGSSAARHEETGKLLDSSRAHVRKSQAQVVASIGQLLAGRPGLIRGPTIGEPSLESVAYLLEILERPCDLDVLLFFHRHPRALLAAQYLVGRVGYGIHEIHASLGVLSAAGLLDCSKGRVGLDAGGVRLYRLT